MSRSLSRGGDDVGHHVAPARIHSGDAPVSGPLRDSPLFQMIPPERVKRSVALVVVRAGVDRGALQLLLVRRPPDDEDLPDVWGLPAGSLRAGEGWKEAVRRAGREKLGVELHVGPLLQEGEGERDGYLLHMRLYRADIVAGEPSVPQAAEGVTQYTDWEWAKPGRLEAGASQGSLCSRLCLRWLGRGE